MASTCSNRLESAGSSAETGIGYGRAFLLVVQEINRKDLDRFVLRSGDQIDIIRSNVQAIDVLLVYLESRQTLQLDRFSRVFVRIRAQN